MKNKVIVAGGGIGGLSAGHHLKALGRPFSLYEGSSEYGGLARSFKWNDVWCDLAPHRLSTQDNKLLEEMLSLVEYKKQSRKSLIYLKGKWIQDPVCPIELIRTMSPDIGIKLIFSWLKAKITVSNEQPATFNEYIVRNYGNKLNDLFFKPYVEKLFATSANSISSDWGRRKVRFSGLKDTIGRSGKLYFNEFYYPEKKGYGALADHLYDGIKDSVTLNHSITGIARKKKGFELSVVDRNGSKTTTTAQKIVSTIPISELSAMLGYELELQYKPIKLVYMQLNRSSVMKEHWRYFIDPKICFNRVTEFKNFSNDHESTNKTVICAEITSDTSKGAPEAIASLEACGLIKGNEVTDTKEITLRHGYPIYSVKYQAEMNRAKEYLESINGLYLVGRQAQFMHIDVEEIYQQARTVVQSIK